MRTCALVLVAALSLVLPAACGHPHGAAMPPASWRLVYPPEARDDRYPRGVHLVRSAPLSEWTAGDQFGSEDDCEASRVQRIDDAIGQARLEHGDEAKFELPVRRAVNARCVAMR